MAADRLLRSALLALAPVSPDGVRPGRLRRAALGSVLRAWFRRRHLLDLLDALGPAPGAAPHGADPRRVVDALRRWPTSCLWRALAGYAALRTLGEEACFVIGVRVARGELLAHAWLERRGRPVGEPEDPRRAFAVAFVHPRPDHGAAEGEESMGAVPRNADVILTELQDGTGVLLHLGTKFYYALNATGVLVWKLLEDGARDADEISRTVAARFDGVTVDAARADVQALMDELRSEGLLRDGR